MLLEEILSKTNMQLAYQRVTGNTGAAGVDGIAAAEFVGQLKTEWEAVKAKLKAGSRKVGN
jgi:RNA-directed DNA polymerase